MRGSGSLKRILAAAARTGEVLSLLTAIAAEKPIVSKRYEPEAFLDAKFCHLLSIFHRAHPLGYQTPADLRSPVSTS